MLKNFDKMCDKILKESTINTDDNEVKPTCAYCGKEVSKEQYDSQKKSYEEQLGKFGCVFKPNMCVCKSCADSLMKFYSDTSSNFRGD